MRWRRLERGWSQDEIEVKLADIGDSAIRQSDISRIERGAVKLPRIERMERSARALDMTVTDLLLESSWVTPEPAK